ncbi:CehA/McbA family metallohydrolase [Oleiharenicola lentus]|uniref:CehA/McbA family metallohydrolase n=1 Tax=Oleiharenicola lentus TaxID=2508720 RepID=UPI003F665AAF
MLSHLSLFAVGCALVASSAHAAWFKGNTHTHTTNSDGNASPEIVTQWYRDHGYQFVVITDHEHLTEVAPLNALHARDGEFLVIQGQEVTQHLSKSRDPRFPTDRPAAHVNAINAKAVAVPLGGTAGKMFGFAPPEVTMAETYARNIQEILAAGGVAQVNHPNWKWSVRLDDLLELPDGTLLEIWNGHFMVNNLGGIDDDGKVAPSAEALWDRLLSRGQKIRGVAADDAHTYKPEDNPDTRPGKAWVVVRAEKLSAEAITTALAAGDFYSSTGIVLDQVGATAKEVSVKINTKPNGPRFLTKFIGQDGKVLAEISGSEPSYQIKGDEGYVRASIIDSNGLRAWTQPVFVGERGR